MITREELFKAVRTIHEFCMSRKRCIQDSGTDWCPIFDCCNRLPKDWQDPEGGDDNG